MREEKLLDLIGQVDCKYVDEANSVKKRKNAHWLRWCALAACVALCICATLAGFSAYQTYNTEVSYICLDVNPSFELCLNRQNTVINAIAYNEDGEELLSKIDYNNKHYEDVMHTILHSDVFEKYLTQDLTITVVSKDDTEILQNIQQYMESAQWAGKVMCSDSQTRDKAYSNHCSVGKYVAYTELAQYDRDVTLDDCKNMTMGEIYEEIEKHHDAHHSNQNGTDSNSNTNTCANHHSEHH